MKKLLPLCPKKLHCPVPLETIDCTYHECFYSVGWISFLNWKTKVITIIYLGIVKECSKISYVIFYISCYFKAFWYDTFNFKLYKWCNTIRHDSLSNMAFLVRYKSPCIFICMFDRDVPCGLWKKLERDKCQNHNLFIMQNTILSESKNYATVRNSNAQRPGR